jgi:hypothetical protein
MIRWRGDTLLGFDAFGRRFVRIAPDGEIVGTVGFPISRSELVIGAPRMSDSAGYLYWDSPVIERDGGRAMRALVVRWRPGSDSIETVAEFSDHAPGEHRLRRRAWPRTDVWVATRSGLVGIVSAADYRLRWFRNGVPIDSGPPVPFIAIRVTAAERSLFRDQKAVEPMASAGMDAGGRMQRAGGDRARAAWPDSLFPAVLPPFEARSAQLAPNGDIWLPRLGPASQREPRLDVLDSRGHRKATIRLAPRQKLVAVTAVSVFVIATDDDGLQTLERYRYPEALLR